MTKTFCKDCICWDRATDQTAQQDAIGFCHLFSPIADPSLFLATFPKTLGGFFCFQGEEHSKESTTTELLLEDK